MGNVLTLVPKKVEEKKPLDSTSTLTKYEALIQLREFYLYIKSDEEKVAEVTKYLLENFSNNYDFPVIPAYMYDDYISLVVPHILEAGEKSDAAFREYSEACQ